MQYDSAASSPVSSRPLDVDADTIAGVLAARRELGPDAEAAVIAAFLERTGHAIDVRVDQRVAQHRAGGSFGSRGAAGGRASPGQRLGLALGSIALGIPATGVAVAFGGFLGVVVAVSAWVAIASINAAYALARP